MATLSTVGVVPLPNSGRARLAAVDWSALQGLAEALQAAVLSLTSGERAERVLDRFLRQNRSLSGPQRAVAAEVVFGISLWRVRLAHVLGAQDWAQAAPSDLIAAFLLSVARASLPENLPLPNNLDLDRTFPSWAEALSFPRWLFDLFNHVLGAQAEPFARVLNQPGPVVLRANTFRVSREQLAAELASENVLTQPCLISPIGLRVTSPRPNIYGLSSYQRGLFEVQDEGSQLLGLLTDAQPGESVLDLCAGAGGKTLLLGAAMQDRGALHAYDIRSESLQRLRQRASRAGLNSLRVHLPSALPANLTVDKVLVDAPCSELGTLRRGPDARFFIQPSDIARNAQLQRSILEDAVAHVRVGGRIIYATCTLAPEENRLLCDAFLESHPELHRVTPVAAWLDSTLLVDGDFSCFPHLHDTDAFFAAVFERTR